MQDRQLWSKRYHIAQIIRLPQALFLIFGENKINILDFRKSVFLKIRVILKRACGTGENNNFRTDTDDCMQSLMDCLSCIGFVCRAVGNAQKTEIRREFSGRGVQL